MNRAPSLYIVSVTYTVPLELIDRYLEAHNSFLKKYYDEKIFVVSGRKEPRTGGIIIAKAENMSIVKNILKEDIFYQKEFAKYDITEVKPTMCSDAFKPVIAV